MKGSLTKDKGKTMGGSSFLNKNLSRALITFQKLLISSKTTLENGTEQCLIHYIARELQERWKQENVAKGSSLNHLYGMWSHRNSHQLLVGMQNGTATWDSGKFLVRLKTRHPSQCSKCIFGMYLNSFHFRFMWEYHAGSGKT